MEEDDTLRVLGALAALYGAALLVATVPMLMRGVTLTALLPGPKILAALSVLLGGIATFRRDRWAIPLLVPGVLLLPVHVVEAAQSIRYGFLPYLSAAAFLYLGGVLTGIYRLRHHLR